MLDTVMTGAAGQLGVSLQEAYRRAAALTPRRQAATPEEIAAVIHFLAGPASAAINGAVIMADAYARRTAEETSGLVAESAQ